MRILDLFCGGGGAAKGYQRAGFEVVGVDHKPQPDYCGDNFIEDDALDFLVWGMARGEFEDGPYDAIHAAPLWHRFAPLQLCDRKAHEDHVTPVLAALEETGLPFVLESGTLGPLPRSDLSLICGATLGLGIVRHMWFKTNWPLMTPGCAHKRGGTTDGTYVAYRSSGKVREGRKTPPRRSTRDWMQEAELDWMSVKQARLASPPAYTELIGHQLAAHLSVSQTGVAA